MNGNPFQPVPPPGPPDDGQESDEQEEREYSPPFIEMFGDFPDLGSRPQFVMDFKTVVTTLLMMVLAGILIFWSLEKIDASKYEELVPVYQPAEKKEAQRFLRE